MAAQSVFAREDTFFGVCFALGEDFGFNPAYLRVLFALLFFWSPLAAGAAYAAVGAVVALSRWLVREPAEVTPAEETAAANEDERQEELPLAA